MIKLNGLILPLAMALLLTPSATSKDTGMWYTPFYAKEMKYTWRTGHGSGSHNQFLADVDNDGDADAIAVFVTGGLAGKWYVAKSNGDGFGGWSQWTSGHGANSSKQLMADVTGDGRADAVAFYGTGGSAGSWYVAAAKASGGFDPYTLWKSGFGAGTSNQMLGDVTGDGKADAIAYNSGKWDVAPSSGSSFGSVATWRTGHGVGSADQFIADADGNGKADAIVAFGSGEWYVAKANSSGTAFGGYSNWTDQTNAQSLGNGASNRMLADINNDGKDDAIAYMSDGDWHMLISNGTNFVRAANSYYKPGSTGSNIVWKQNHGNDNQIVDYSATTWTGVADVYGNNHPGPVVFKNSGGIWQAIPGAYHASQPGTYDNYYYKPTQTNTWEARNYGYVPVGGTYDSGDTAKINAHLSELNAADVDFILLDLTNKIFNDRKRAARRAADICDTVVASSTGVQFAIAIDGRTSPASLESEAKHAWNLFLGNGSGTYEAVDKCAGTPRYFDITEGSVTKPLLAVYVDSGDRQAWENYTGSKTYANNFNIKWVQGTVRSSNLGSYPASDYIGWVFNEGAIKNNDLMTFSPGWDNHGTSSTPPVPRDNANFYKEKGWERVVCDGTMPDMVVIASYNEYGEETAVAPSDTSALPLNKQWSSPGRYWDITEDFNAAYKAGTTGICSLFVDRSTPTMGALAQ